MAHHPFPRPKNDLGPGAHFDQMNVRCELINTRVFLLLSSLHKPAVFPLVDFLELAGSDYVQLLMNGEGPIGHAQVFDGVIKSATKARQIRVL